MPFCTLAGITVPCVPDATSDDPALKVGFKGIAFDGTLRSTVYQRKRRWTLKTAKIPSTTITALVNACDSGQTVVLNGDIVGNVAVNVKAQIGETPWHVAFAPFWKSTTITVEEI